MSLIDFEDDEYGVDEAGASSSDQDNLFESPRTQNRLIGHLAQKKLIQDLFDKGQMPHAWILKGPSGIGKETFAFQFSKFLLSKGAKHSHKVEEQSMFGGLDLGVEPETDTSNNIPMSYDLKHPAIDRIHSSGHGDLLFLDVDDSSARQEIKVDQVRDAVRFLQKTSSEGGWRIVIINSADAMNSSAQNALLKVLEEPPSNTVLILVTSAVSRMLPTIRSRCRVLDFDKLSDPDMKELIATSNILEDSDIDLNKALAFAEGRFGYLRSFIEDQGFELFNYILEGLSSFPKIDRHAVFNIGQKINADRNNNRINRFLRLFEWWCENLIKHFVGIRSYTFITDEERSVVEALENYCESEKAVEALMNICEKLNQMHRDNSWASLDKQTLVLNAFINFENEFKKVK
ncbi:MAG: hypothetical protein CMP22_05235 [Rickettsiales bacterium]|nr:hypothetical protein [Rickettsiales bacterium]